MEQLNKRTENILLAGILFLAASLRFYNFSGFSLSNDELSALARLRFKSFSEMIEKGVMIDFHPAGVQIFLFYWIKFFGISEFAFRLPFVITGIGSVYLIYLVGKKWFNVVVGLVSASALCVLEFPILYSQLARPYSPGLFFTLLACYFWTEIFIDKLMNKPVISEKKPKLLIYAGFIFSVSICMYIHYFALLQAGLFCIAGLFFLSKENIKSYLISGIIILFLYVPHLKIFMHQMSIGGIGGEQGWLGKPDNDFLCKYIQYVFNNSILLLLVFILIFIFSLIIFRKKRSKNKFRQLSFLFFITPFLIGYYYSIYRNPILQYSVLLFSFPFFILFIFSFVARLVQPRIVIAVVFAILVFGSFSTVYQNKYYSTKHFGVFKEIAEKTIEFDNKYGEQNVTRTVNVINPYYINYYFDKFQRNEKFVHYHFKDYSNVSDFAKFVEQSTTNYFVHAWSNTFDPPELEDVILEYYPFIVSKNNFFNSGITLYSKKSGEAITMEKPLYESSHDFESVKWENDSMFLNDSIFHSGKRSAFMDEKTEYGPTFSLAAHEIELKKGDTIKISSWFYPLQEKQNAKLVFSIEGNENSKVWISREFKIYQAKTNQWQQVFLNFIVNVDLDGNEILKSYVWNDKKESFFLDDFKFRVFR